MREQRLPLKIIRQRHGLRRPHTVFEEADGVIVGALRVQVEEDCYDHLTIEKATNFFPLRGRMEKSLGVKEDTRISITEKERGASCRETKAEIWSPLWCTSSMITELLDDLRFETIATSLHGCV